MDEFVNGKLVNSYLTKAEHLNCRCHESYQQCFIIVFQTIHPDENSELTAAGKAQQKHWYVSLHWEFIFFINETKKIVLIDETKKESYH